MNPENQKIYDLSYLYEVIGDDFEAIAELIRIFVQHTPSDLDNLNRAYQSGDREQLAAIAHKLKSSVATLRIGHLSETLQRIDKPFKVDSLKDQLPEIINEINKVLNEALQQLREDFSKT